MTEESAPEGVFVLPASYGQERLWLLDRIGAGAAYHITGAVRVRGALDVAALRRGLLEVCRRHEALRTTFEFGIDGWLIQVVHPEPNVSLEERNVTDRPPEEREGALAEILGELRDAPFDLAHGLLLRAVAVRLGNRHWAFGIALHHIIADGWSLGILLSELAHHYDSSLAGRALPELAIQYGDWAVWQREQTDTASRARAYWVEQMRGARPTALPVAAASAETDVWRGAEIPVALSADLARSLRLLGEQEQATLFMVLLTGLGIVLSRWCDQDDLVIGTPIAGRDRAEVQELIGFFVNTLPLRLTVPRGATVRSALRRTRRTCLNGYAHQELPFERIADQAKASRGGRSPLVRVLFALDNLPLRTLRLADLEAEPIDVPLMRTQTDLAVHLMEGPDGGLHGQVIYAAELWDSAHVENLAAAWQMVLAAMAERPDDAVGRLPLASPAERERLTGEFSGAAVPPVGSGLAHAPIEDRCRAQAGTVAVQAADGTVTYGRLAERADRLARCLRERGIGPGGLVGVCVARSAAMVVAQLAAIKAGAAYLPVDPGYPPEWIGFVLDDGRVDVVLVDRSTADLADRYGRSALRVDEPYEPAGRPPPIRIDPTDLVYVVYTSGSTGAPKGTMNTHRAVANRVAWMQREFRIGGDDAVLQKTPAGFDVAAWEWLWPLTAGARLVMARPGGHRDPGYLAQLIQERQITTCHFVPSMLRAFLAEPAAAGCTGALRRVLCSGEELAPDLACWFAEVLPGVELYNLYGPAETAIDVTCQRVGPENASGGRVPIGRPIPGVRLTVGDRGGEPVPVGMAGELFIGGIAVGWGYLRRPGLTAERFLPDPAAYGERMYRTGDRVRWRADGALEFLGRFDDQLKIRGHRIEPGEIESVLRRHPTVREALVRAVGDDVARRRLVAYVECPQSHPAHAELRGFLLDRLPPAFVPDTFVVIPRLPVSANGKIDRSRLPEPHHGEARATGTRVLPSTPGEQMLAEIWSLVLDTEDVGVTDDFYELGGDSLRAVAVFQQARERGVVLPLQRMLGEHTIGQLIEWLREDPATALEQLNELSR